MNFRSAKLQELTTFPLPSRSLPGSQALTTQLNFLLRPSFAADAWAELGTRLLNTTWPTDMQHWGLGHCGYTQQLPPVAANNSMTAQQLAANKTVGKDSLAMVEVLVDVEDWVPVAGPALAVLGDTNLEMAVAVAAPWVGYDDPAAC